MKWSTARLLFILTEIGRISLMFSQMLSLRKIEIILVLKLMTYIGNDYI